MLTEILSLERLDLPLGKISPLAQMLAIILQKITGSQVQRVLAINSTGLVYDLGYFLKVMDLGGIFKKVLLSLDATFDILEPYPGRAVLDLGIE